MLGQYLAPIRADLQILKDDIQTLKNDVQILKDDACDIKECNVMFGNLQQRYLGNGTGHPRGVGKLTRTLTHEDRVLDLTG